MPVVERGEHAGVVGERCREDEEMEDLVRGEEVVECAGGEAFRDAVRAAQGTRGDRPRTWSAEDGEDDRGRRVEATRWTGGAGTCHGSRKKEGPKGR